MKSRSAYGALALCAASLLAIGGIGSGAQAKAPAYCDPRLPDQADRPICRGHGGA